MNLLFLTEKKLRKIIKEVIEELNNYRSSRDSLNVKNNITGAELIMPNLIKEKFDNKEIISLKDII